MYCPNCGNKLVGNEEYCPNCGSKLNKETTSEKLAHSAQKHFQNVSTKVKSFYTKYQKNIKLLCISILIIGGIYLVLLNMGILSFLRWDKTYKDYKLDLATQSNLTLGINLNGNPDKIKYTTTCGKITSKDKKITWDLNDATGNCQITAKYKLLKINKKIKIIPFEVEDKNMAIDYKIDINSDEDLDYDGLTNKQETEANTNPELFDSDMDNLDDNYELNVSHTDPNQKDTDKDGLTDYNEIQMGLDPLKAISKEDGIEDGKRELTYSYEDDKYSLQLSGTGNLASLATNITNNTKISNKKGLIDNLYTFYTDGNLNNAILKIKYSDEELTKYEINEDDLSIYYYNDKTSNYEKVQTSIDKENKILTAQLEHFSNYVVGDINASLNKENEVLFILDNSWSMYSKEDYIKAKGDSTAVDTIEETDKDGLRFTLSAKLIKQLEGKNYKVGLSEFRQDYANILPIGSNTKTILEKIPSMKGNFVTNLEGTYIYNALEKGINDFSSEENNKYIILLTDGQDTSYFKNVEKVIEKATNNNIKICSIGFGSGANNADLANISNATGCKFLSSSNSQGLDELFSSLKAELNDSLVDVDGDNNSDGVLIADSGFIVNKNGFSFPNYSSVELPGHCYGMATFAELYFTHKLPLSLASKQVKNNTTYAYDLNNTYFKDYANLYDYQLKTKDLKYIFGFTIFNETNPSDFKVIKGNHLIINEPYRTEILNSNLYDIVAGKTTWSEEKQIKTYGFTYETAEGAYLSEEKMQKAMNNEDLQLFNAISTSFYKQLVSTNYSSSSNFLLWARDVIGSEDIAYKGKQGFINILKTRLENNEAPVINSDFDGGLHAINAISLVQDIDNPNYYYIGVYDNNFPNEKRYVDLECNEETCVTRSNSFYSSYDEPIRISPSLEYDLQYFQN